jgi:excisionase family DNA binding protein
VIDAIDIKDSFDDTERGTGVMDMSVVDVAVQELKALARELEDRGDAQLARRVGRAISALEAEPGRAELDLMTTGEAAQSLGIRSVNTIKRWAAQGLLDGFRRGGRILVSRASVEKMKGHKSLKQEIAFERELDEALDPFDFGDESVPEFYVSRTGRKPWEQSAGTGSKSPSH